MDELNIREPEDRVSEWEVGLPTADDLTPLSQNLIPPELAAAFSITPEPHRSILELNREAQNTLSSLNGSLESNFKAFADESEDLDPDGSVFGSASRKIRRLDSGGGVEEAEIFNNDLSAKTQIRPRLVWTPQLHRRFVDVVAHLGIKNAVPKSIMQLMNVEGLTRENVASHLQKYRLYLKRMSVLSIDGPSPSNHLFTSTSVPQSLQEPAAPMPITNRPMMMPYGMGHGNTASSGAYHGYLSHPYHMVQLRDWSGSR